MTCVNLNMLRNAWIEMLFLGESGRVSREEITIYTGRLSKGDCLHQCGWPSFNLLGT